MNILIVIGLIIIALMVAAAAISGRRDAVRVAAQLLAGPLLEWHRLGMGVAQHTARSQ